MVSKLGMNVAGFDAAKINTDVNEYKKLKKNYKNLSDKARTRLEKLKTEFKKFGLVQSDGNIDNKRLKDLSIFDVAAQERNKGKNSKVLV